MQSLQPLRETVQRNCHISDAQYARNYTMCVYLLKMREYYRWEKGYALGDKLPGGEVGEWVDARERMWEALEAEDLRCLPLERECVDPFDAEGANAALVPEGLVYSGGVGRFGKPHFFLGRLVRRECHGALTVFVSDQEFARDLTAPPAMLQGRQVFIRRESLRRTLWEMVEEWRWQRRPGPMARVLEAYGFDEDPQDAMERFTDGEVGSVILHEVGEGLAGEALGPDWEAMLAAVSGTPAELTCRAVRDNLADCLSTLPALLDRDEPAAVHAYFANFGGLRRQMFPGAMEAYERWVAGEGAGSLRDLLPAACEHWLATGRSMLEAFRTSADPVPAIQALADARTPY